MAKFENKTVWITGASSGIGEACAYLFAQEKANLILTASGKEALVKTQDMIYRIWRESQRWWKML